jgi:hypothetical protein
MLKNERKRAHGSGRVTIRSAAPFLTETQGQGFRMTDISCSTAPVADAAPAVPREPSRHADTWKALRRGWPKLAGAAAVAASVAGCSSWSLTGGSAAPETTAAAPSDGSFSSRVKSFFGGAGSFSSAGSSGFTCPGVEYRQGAATWTVKGPSADALSLRYQASFIQTARECIVADDRMTIKVGVQGRMVLGPAGSPGTINVPLRYALVREGLQPKTLWTRFFTVPVSVPAGDGNVSWVHVEEEMTVPRPSPQDLEGYVVYVGFDPDSGSKTAPAKPKTARSR